MTTKFDIRRRRRQTVQAVARALRAEYAGNLDNTKAALSVYEDYVRDCMEDPLHMSRFDTAISKILQSGDMDLQRPIHLLKEVDVLVDNGGLDEEEEHE